MVHFLNFIPNVTPEKSSTTGLLIVVLAVVALVLVAFLIYALRTNREKSTSPAFGSPEWQRDYDAEIAAARIEALRRYDARRQRQEEAERGSMKQPSTPWTQREKALRRRQDRESRQQMVLVSVRDRLNRILSLHQARSHLLYKAYCHAGGLGSLGEFEKALDICCAQGLVQIRRERPPGSAPGSARVKLYAQPAARQILSAQE